MTSTPYVEGAPKTLARKAAEVEAAHRPKLPGSLDVNRRLSQWLRIHAEGRVTIRPGKVEIGQGILTALAQIAADELDVAFGRIAVEPASAPTSPDEGVTSGSRSIQDSGMAIRHACAAARAIYLSIVAQKTGVPLEALRVEDGVFLGPAGKVGSYWEQPDPAILECEAPADVKPKAIAARAVAGTAAPRLDLPDKVFGVPRFIHDLRLPGMRFARVVRPPSRGAQLVEAPTGLADAQVIRDGNFLAVVCATEPAANAAAVRAAARARWAEVDALPEENALPDVLRGLPAETTKIAEKSGGDAPAPARVLKADFFRPYIAHASIGPSCALACFAGDTMEVWTHSQSIYNLRADLALALDLERERIVVHHREGAGCYGHNGADDVALDAALIAKAVPGVPIRVQWSREDELGWSPFAAAMTVSVEAGVDGDGNLVSWRQEVVSNGHSGRPGQAKVPALLAASHIAQPFAMPLPINPPPAAGGGADRNAVPLYETGALQVQSHRLLEMPLRVSAFRGLGAMANVLAIESVMDELAAQAGRDPAEYRLAHLKDPRGRDVIEAVLAMSAWPSADGAEGRGRGLAFARYKNNSAYCAAVAEVEAEAEVRVRRLWLAVDAGEVINPEGVAHQVEGGAVQACSCALKEAVQFDRRTVTSNTWESYPILRFSEVPAVETRVLHRPELPPLGAGECSTGPVVAAIANAIFDALGIRLRSLPFTAERIAAEALR